MRKLIDTPNAGGITAAYPDGSIVDQTGETTGTALTDILYGDLIQMIHKIKRLSGITENNLPDNETNGFQLMTAFFSNSLPMWQSTSSKVDFSKTKFVSYNNGVYYHKTTTNTNNNPSIDSTNWAVVFYWNGTKLVFSEEARFVAIEQTNTTQQLDIDALELAVHALELAVTQYNELIYTSTQLITGATTGISSRQITFEREGNLVCVNGYFVASGTASTSDIIAQVSSDFYPKTIMNPISATDINVCQLILMTDGKLKYRNNTPPLLISNQLNFSYFV